MIVYAVREIITERGNSMNLINIEKLTKSYTERKLFEDASFSLPEGEKVGISVSMEQARLRYCG